MADADDKTSELIAKLLSEDSAYANYYDDRYGEDQSDESDYGDEGRRKRPKKAGARKANKTSNLKLLAAREGKASADAAAAAPVGTQQHSTVGEGDREQRVSTTEETTATGRRRRKDAGAVREKARSWSEDEERLFLEALEMHGRDWKACSAHVGTRDARSFASHAQKHFIKLCIKGERLPDRVAESGAGYTLSGKPLDPESAAAKAYGLKPDVLKNLQASNSGSLAGMAISTADLDAGKENDKAANTTTADEEAVRNCAEGNHAPELERHPVDAQTKAAQPRKCSGRKAVRAAAHSPDQPAAEPPEPTEYVRNRPRREVQGPRNMLGHTSESLELVKCMDFVGPPGSGAPLAQPFQVHVQPQAVLLMDLHAHLSSSEVIGLLGGVWDADKRRIDVVCAFPCRRAVGTQSGTSVELDPAAEVETRALMAAASLTPVGWYHSHPVFAPKPSQKDSENQRNYQALFRCAASKLEPFLGVIVSPYDVQLPGPASCMTWFVVRTRQGALTPYHVRVNASARQSAPDLTEAQALRQVIDMVRDDVTRTDFTLAWRSFTAIQDGQPQGPPLSKADKLLAAMALRIAAQGAESPAVLNLIDTIRNHLESVWSGFPSADGAPDLRGVHPGKKYTGAPTFRKGTREWEYLREKDLCFHCLGPGHTTSECTKRGNEPHKELVIPVD